MAEEQGTYLQREGTRRGSSCGGVVREDRSTLGDFRQEDSEGRGLSSLSLGKRHPEAWQDMRFVLWLPEDGVEYITQQEVGGRQAETPEPSIDGPASSLSTIAEDSSELTEDTLFIHDEPNCEAVDLEATRACLLQTTARTSLTRQRRKTVQLGDIPSPMRHK